MATCLMTQLTDTTAPPDDIGAAAATVAAGVGNGGKIDDQTLLAARGAIMPRISTKIFKKTMPLLATARRQRRE